MVNQLHNIILQQATDLANSLFQVSSGLSLPKGNHWDTVVTVSLGKANRRLGSIMVLLNRGDVDSAVILTRSLWELALNLAYIHKDVANRLPKYLEHGCVPITDEEIRHRQHEPRGDQRSDIEDIVPKRTWEHLANMCNDLDDIWTEEYKTFYRYSSISIHSGAFTLGKNYYSLLDTQPHTDYEGAACLLSALEFHIRVMKINAQVFPEHFDLHNLNEQHSQLQRIGKSLAQLSKSLGKHKI